MLKRLLTAAAYNIEIITQLITVTAISAVYGVIESWYIPTGLGTFRAIPICGGRWSYYHLWLLALVGIASFSLALSHIQWLLSHRKKYILLVCSAMLPLGLMVEDIAWFLARWRPIHRDEWTMIVPGLGINLGVTWVPIWYVGVCFLSGTLLWLADHYATKAWQRSVRESTLRMRALASMIQRQVLRSELRRIKKLRGVQ